MAYDVCAECGVKLSLLIGESAVHLVILRPGIFEPNLWPHFRHYRQAFFGPGRFLGNII